jgi:hypothetical protein
VWFGDRLRQRTEIALREQRKHGCWHTAKRDVGPTLLTDEGELDAARTGEIGHPDHGNEDSRGERSIDGGSDAGRGGRNHERDAEVDDLEHDACDHERDHDNGEGPPLREEEVQERADPDEQRRIDHELAHDQRAEERMVGAGARGRDRMPRRGIEGTQASDELRGNANRREAQADRHEIEPPADPVGPASELFAITEPSPSISLPVSSAASLAGHGAIDKGAPRAARCGPCASSIFPSR